jgi:siroheme synthase-like protein
MRTHPVALCLEGRRCVVVGGDLAAEGKARACLEAGAVVTLVAPEPTPGLRALGATGQLRHLAREYEPGDLSGAFLAYASVDSPSGAAALRAEAERERVLLNVIDKPEACSFIAPAVVARGSLTIAVGTGGASPGLAARLRRRLDELFGPEYGPYVAILGAVRQRLAGDPGRGDVLGILLDSPLLDLVSRRDRAAVDRLLAQTAGDGCTLAALGITLDDWT